VVLAQLSELDLEVRIFFFFFFCSSFHPQNIFSARVLRLHKRAARCGDVDTKCVTRLFAKIARIRRQLASRKCGVVRNAAKKIRKGASSCSPGTTFRQFLANRRARISRLAQACGDEDDQCIRNAMNMLVRLNSNLPRQNKIWRRSCAPSLNVIVLTPKKIAKGWKACFVFVFWLFLILVLDTRVTHFIPRTIWTHEFTCARIQRGFRLWLAGKVSQRRSFHAESKRCEASDLMCIKQNFDSIIRVQRSIHRGRSLYADRMSTCDRCAPIKLRWYRWLKRQRQRRHRLQLAACRCAEPDHACMQRNVDRIKRIQINIRARRAEALRLHGQCVVPKTTKATTVMPGIETYEPDL
jgi:hypothetical protein